MGGGSSMWNIWIARGAVMSSWLSAILQYGRGSAAYAPPRIVAEQRIDVSAQKASS